LIVDVRGLCSARFHTPGLFGVDCLTIVTAARFSNDSHCRFGQVDVGTGVFTALVSAQNAPGFTFGSPHGVAFVPDKNAAPSPQITAIKTFPGADGRTSVRQRMFP